MTGNVALLKCERGAGSLCHRWLSEKWHSRSLRSFSSSLVQNQRLITLWESIKTETRLFWEIFFLATKENIPSLLSVTGCLLWQGWVIWRAPSTPVAVERQADAQGRVIFSANCQRWSPRRLGGNNAFDENWLCRVKPHFGFWGHLIHDYADDASRSWDNSLGSSVERKFWRGAERMRVTGWDGEAFWDQQGQFAQASVFIPWWTEEHQMTTGVYKRDNPTEITSVALDNDALQMSQLNKWLSFPMAWVILEYALRDFFCSLLLLFKGERSTIVLGIQFIFQTLSTQWNINMLFVWGSG